MPNDISPENASLDASNSDSNDSSNPAAETANTTDMNTTNTTNDAAPRHRRSVDEPLNDPDQAYVPKHYAKAAGDGGEDEQNVRPSDTPDDTSDELHEPTIESIENADGPMTSMLHDPSAETQESPTHTHTGSRNRAARRAKSSKKIGPEAIKRQTQERVRASKREQRVRELPEDVRDLLGKITAPEVTARTKDTPLHKWSREDALNMFFTLGHVHAKMMCPIPDDEGTVVPAVSLIQAGDSVGVFYPVTEDSQSHILTTVHDPRHYMSAAERDLVNDGALQALSETAEQIVTGVYSLAGSLTPGSDAREIADLMGQLDEMHAKD